MDAWSIFCTVFVLHSFKQASYTLQGQFTNSTQVSSCNIRFVINRSVWHLLKRKDIVIKAADKGGAFVVWSRPLYIAEANRQLSDGRFYERLDHDPLNENQNVVKTTITEMIRDNKLPPSAKGLIVPTPQTSRFYLLPKIHKAGNNGRPIVSACCCPTENIASYLDQIMCPLVRNLGTYVKDTNHALRIFNDFHFDNTATG